MSKVYHMPFIPETLPGVGRLAGNGGGGGSMDNRVRALEDSMGQIKIDMSIVKERLSHLATQSALETVKADIASINAQIPHLATKAELSDLKASLIQWMVSTMLASAGLAAAISFGLARLIKG